MPKRWCSCTGCAACNTTTRTHGVLYDMDATGTLRCPACQPVVDAARAAAWSKRGTQKARPSSSARGLGWTFTKQKQTDHAYQAATCCHWCGGPFTADNPKTGDHDPPRSTAGPGGRFVAACRRCNSSRGGRLRWER